MGFVSTNLKKDSLMPAAGTKSLTVQISSRLVDSLEAFATARTVLSGKRVNKADILAEALEGYFNVGPRLEQLGDVADLINSVRKLEANLSDQIERGFKAMSAAKELREENEVLNAAALYSLDTAHSFEDVE